MKIRVFLAIASRVAPGFGALDPAARDRAIAIVQHAVAARPPSVQRQLALFLSVVRWLPVLRFGRPFERLDAARQDAVLHWFHDAPITALRQGFWGVKTLVLMGYYGRPEAGEAIGYRPSRSGNDLLRAR